MSVGDCEVASPIMKGGGSGELYDLNYFALVTRAPQLLRSCN